jgi:hypothetical protein
VEDVPRAAGLVTRAQLTVAGHAVEPPFELWQIIRQAIKSRRCLGLAREDGDGDRLLVDIHPEIDDWASRSRL